MEEYKKVHIINKKIKDITKDDSKVSFIGEILERSNNRLVVGDEDSEIEVVYDDIDVPGSKIVRVIGKVQFPLHIKAEIIQSFSGFDFELYDKVKHLNKR